MGSSVSKGQNNDELIDNLIDAGYIRTPVIECAFRSVDRGNYIPDESRHMAYRDMAWKGGPVHLSASCIYSEVMESLAFRPGLSFLNIGSGTGYFSTMVGLILGSYGVNHGIEENESTVQYAEVCLDTFINNELPKLVHFNFCQPKFIVGNILLWKSSIFYDRIYCGARCPADVLNVIKSFLKIKGLLVVPVGNKLMKIRRLSATKFKHEYLTSVSFASLIMPFNIEVTQQTLCVDPPTLMELCRSDIRNKLQQTIFNTHPELRSMFRTVMKLPNNDEVGDADHPNDKPNKKPPHFNLYKGYDFKKSGSKRSSTAMDTDQDESDDSRSFIALHADSGDDNHENNALEPAIDHLNLPNLLQQNMSDDVESSDSQYRNVIGLLTAFDSIQQDILGRISRSEENGELRTPNNSVPRPRRRFVRSEGENRRERVNPGGFNQRAAAVSSSSIVSRFKRVIREYKESEPSTSRGRSGRAANSNLKIRNVSARNREFSDVVNGECNAMEDSDTDSVDSYVVSVDHNASATNRISSNDPVLPMDVNEGRSPVLFDQLTFKLDEFDADVSAPSSPSSDFEDSSSSEDASDSDMDTRPKLPPNRFSDFLKLYHICLNSELDNLALPYLLKNYIGYSKVLDLDQTKENIDLK